MNRNKLEIGQQESLLVDCIFFLYQSQQPTKKELLYSFYPNQITQVLFLLRDINGNCHVHVKSHCNNQVIDILMVNCDGYIPPQIHHQSWCHYQNRCERYAGWGKQNWTELTQIFCWCHYLYSCSLECL